MMRKLAVTVFALSFAAFGCGSDSGTKTIDSAVPDGAGKTDVVVTPGVDGPVTDVAQGLETQPVLDTAKVDTTVVDVSQTLDQASVDTSSVDGAKGVDGPAVDGGKTTVDGGKTTVDGGSIDTGSTKVDGGSVDAAATVG